jgi:phosphoglycolate phosphatase
LIPFEKIKTIYFDYDGTLHDSIKIYASAFKKAYNYLVEENLAEERSWTDEEIGYWLGFNPKEMWENFMPDLELSKRDQCSKIIGNEMKTLIEEGKGQLYDGTIETLEYLKDRGYKLVFISNCNTYYMDTHNKLFQLHKYFENFVCSEQYKFIPKYEILSKIMHNYPKEMVIVGDRSKDIEAGVKNHIYTIGCSYGYALPRELDEVDLLINDIKELKNYF